MKLVYGVHPLKCVKLVMKTGANMNALVDNDLAYATVAHCGRKCVDRHIFDHAGAKATITDTVGYGA